jgi:dUTP pyrophosphatase
MKVKFKKLRDNAKLPVKKYDDDFCYDVYACDCIEISPGVYKYPLGFAMQLDRSESIDLLDGSAHYKANQKYHKVIMDFDFRPRSSIHKTGMVLCNAPGTVDYSYTGEVCAYFYHVIPTLPKYEAGDRVCQMKLGFTVPLEFEVVEELEETDRGEGGFGSTGKN